MTDSPADSHDVIRIRGARANNLQDVSLDIPKRRLTVFTGVSGSGKSSLVFGTIAAEAQRLINETYSAFVQGFMPSLARPDVDLLQNLSAAIIVDQERMGANSRSTVGTATDVNAMLRILFSKLGRPSVGPAFMYGFNSVEGMCTRCEGLGEINDIALDQLFDRTKSIEDGAITIPGYTPDGWLVRIFAESGFVPANVPISDFTEQQLQDFLYKESTKVRVTGINMTYEGLVPKVQKSILSKDRDAVQPHIRAFIDRAVAFTTCPDCNGSRLNEAVRSSKIGATNIADASAMQITNLAEFVRGIDDAVVAPLISTLQETLDTFVGLGLGYLSLDRKSGTLSGGEAQRVKMVRHLGSALTDITYVFDEPTVGLHPHDIQRMNELLLRLRDKGNTVLVVEHKPETIAIADHVVDLGPGAGRNGGHIQFEGTVDELRRSGTLTGNHLDHRASLRGDIRSASGQLSITHATLHNLKDVSVDIPTGVLTVVTGVAGSGKSSLMYGSMPKSDSVTVVDQAPIRGSRRSNPATYTGLLDPIRAAFAKANKVKPALFSANSEGACPNCKGIGLVFSDLAMIAGVATVCEVCEGRRFTDEVLGYTLDGQNISEVLAMPVAEALEFFAEGPAHDILQRLDDVGLGYISIGQPLTTLSGGERQRMKLAIHMGGGKGIYVLDEPTTGLHLADVDKLLALLDRLVDAGNTVIVIEHHQAVMAHADWIIDVGPGAGQDGGTIVFEGTPADLVGSSETLTAQHLRLYVGA
ncbi:MAG: excinuclease subunit [Microbacteriaceae bacterium]|nr:excinuclease subunit [Microbacteriaceae bacterium]